MKNVLITGGSGYLGGRIANYLTSFNEYNIFIASRNDYKNNNKFNYRKIDWASKNSLQNICQNIEIIIHLAAMNAKECYENPEKAYEINVLNTKKLIESAVINNVKKVIYFSTAHVYSSLLSGVIDEKTSTLNPHSYAKTHLLAEKFILDFNKKSNCQGIVLRLSNSFGAPLDLNSNCWMLFANDICKSGILNSKITINSDSLQLRNFITLSDVCRVTKHFVQYNIKKNLNPVFNVGGKSTMSLIDFAKLVQNELSLFLNEKVEIISKSNNKKKSIFEYNIDKLENTGFVLESKIKDEIFSLIKFCNKNFKIRL